MKINGLLIAKGTFLGWVWSPDIVTSSIRELEVLNLP